MRFLRSLPRLWKSRPALAYRILQDAHISTTRMLVELQQKHQGLIDQFEALAREVKLLRETEAASIAAGLEADRKTQLAELMQTRAEQIKEEAEAKVADAARQLMDQIALNADLVQGKFDTTLDIGRHSAAIDQFKIQVLTQMRTENLVVGARLIPALMQTFAFNVAQHLVKRLTEEGGLRTSRTAQEVVASLPPHYVPQDPSTIKLQQPVSQRLRLLDNSPVMKNCRQCGGAFFTRIDENLCQVCRPQ